MGITIKTKTIMKKKFQVTVNITTSNTIEVEAENESQVENAAMNLMGDDPYYYCSEHNGAHCEEYFVVETAEV